MHRAAHRRLRHRFAKAGPNAASRDLGCTQPWGTRVRLGAVVVSAVRLGALLLCALCPLVVTDRLPRFRPLLWGLHATSSKS